MYLSNNNTAWLRWSYVQASKMPSWKGLVCRSFKFHRKTHRMPSALVQEHATDYRGTVLAEIWAAGRACEKMACVVTGKRYVLGKGNVLPSLSGHRIAGTKMEFARSNVHGN